MPRKNAIKEYVEDGFYHIYNRGVEKRKIFCDKQDYVVFLRYLKEYLLPADHPNLVSLQRLNPKRKTINCNSEVELVAFCLMPNHFHLFLRQKTIDGLKNFMKALSTNYVMYFNKKYQRIGPLFQGVYKAVLVKNDSYFLYITRYIHRNPLEILSKTKPLENYDFSSYPVYCAKKCIEWINPNHILDNFNNPDRNLSANSHGSYKSFVEESADDEAENQCLPAEFWIDQES